LRLGVSSRSADPSSVAAAELGLVRTCLLEAFRTDEGQNRRIGLPGRRELAVLPREDVGRVERWSRVPARRAREHGHVGAYCPSGVVSSGEERALSRVSRETAIGVAVTTLAIVAMAFDHLDVTGDDFPADPLAFLISSALSLIIAAIAFGFVIPRVKADGAPTERAARQGIVWSIAAVVPGLGFVWLGVTFVLAGAGIALGLLGRRGERKRLATAAVAVGVVALALSIVATDVEV
jgi:hypothetical protein